MKPLKTCPDPKFGPNMIWEYVVVTERVNKVNKTELRESVCVNEEHVKRDVADFLKREVDNPDAIKGTHYNFAIFSRRRDLEDKFFPPPPRPDVITDNRALYPMRRHKGWDYNIFNVEGSRYAGVIFDIYRRPYYQTVSAATTEMAIKMSRATIDLLVKGQCVTLGFKIDAGRAIREKEETAQKEAAKTRRKGGKS